MTRLARHVKKMESGESVYINAINGTAKEIDDLREFIKSGVLIPDADELNRSLSANIDDNTRIGYETGVFILPQMTYVKR